jgi:hypothetical protein
LRTRPRWFLLGLGALIVLALFAFPTWWPLIARTQVQDPFPGVPAEEHALLETMQAVDPTQAAATYLAGTPTVVPEEEQALPEMEMPIIVARGEFMELDALHWARGSVTLFKQTDGSHILRFEDFEARNGPELHVLLSVHPEPRTSAQVHQGAGAIELGALSGSVGAQSYAVPGNIDLSLYNSVVLYSRAFDAVFSVANLTPEAF